MYTVAVHSQGEHATVVETDNPASFAPAGAYDKAPSDSHVVAAYTVSAHHSD